MLKYLFSLILLAIALTACSDDSESIPLCNCEPDEYCVDDECFPTNSSIIPAPEEKK